MPAGSPSETARPEGLRAVVEEIADLRPFPAAAARILEISAGERFGAQDLAAAVANDPALTARLLRLANSAYYGFPRRISTVRDAVVLVGFREARQAALLACLAGRMRGTSNVDEEAFWRHAVHVGLLAETLGRERADGGGSDVADEEAFVAGLLHDVGVLALDQRRPDALRAALERARLRGTPRHEAQRALLGFTDAELGSALAERWGFPPALAAAVGAHGAALPPPDEDELAALVVRACLLTRTMGIGDGLAHHALPDPMPPRSEPDVALRPVVASVSKRAEVLLAAAS